MGEIKMKTIASLIFVLGAVSSQYPYYGYVHSPFYHTLQYSNYGRLYSPYSPRVVLPTLRKTSLTVDSTHPGTAAALSYISKNFNLDSCGKNAKAYLDSIQAGNSREVASQAAAAVYQQNYAAGVPASPAYMEASPSDSPCYVSAKEYIQATIAGYSDANLAAVKAFASQISTLAKQGKTTIDGACLEAAQAYSAASEIPSSATAAAMNAFIQRALQTGNIGYDPVCAAAGEAYIGAILEGASEKKAVEAAGAAFVSAVDFTPGFQMDSHCGKAAQAFMANF